MRKINVLHILNTSDIGGAEKLMIDICKYTDKNKFNLVITSFEKGALEKEFKKFNHVKKIDLNSPGYFSFKTLLRLNKLIRKEKLLDIFVLEFLYYALLRSPSLFRTSFYSVNPKKK